MEQIILPGVLASLQEVTGFVTGQARSAGMDDRAVHKVQLALDELVTNIITHGYDEEGLDGNVIVRVETTPEALIVTTEDTAVPFDPRNSPEPASLSLPLEERPIGGMGIHFIRKSADRHEYDHQDGKNCNRLFFVRPPVTSQNE